MTTFGIDDVEVVMEEILNHVDNTPNTDLSLLYEMSDTAAYNRLSALLSRTIFAYIACYRVLDRSAHGRAILVEVLVLGQEAKNSIGT